MAMDFFDFIIYNTNIVKYFCKGGGNMKGIDIAKYIVNRRKTNYQPPLTKDFVFCAGRIFCKDKKMVD